MMFLPHELIIQILLRLPVKSLLRFKCVCKLWFSLISHDSQFANSHFQLNSATHTRRLFISTSNHETRSVDFEAPLDDVSASVSLNLPEDFKGFEIKGSCRGFILFCSSLNIYLWNPSTGIHKQIPFSPFGSNLDAKYFYGFGYDDSTDDYLVVSMSQHHHSEYFPRMSFRAIHLEYFSLKANKWKLVEGPHFRYTFKDGPNEPRGGCLYKGSIHWLAYRNDLRNDVIIAFDLMERKLSYMLVPHPLQCGGLWVYGEFLSLYTKNYSDDDTVEIWVMKKYKVIFSWTMTLVLPLDCIPNEDFSLLCCTKSGDIIMTDDGSRLVKYDENGQFLEQHSYSNYDLRLQGTMYIDSLLSLPSDGDNEQA